MTLLPMLAWADESGTCGDNLTWTYYEYTQSLVITGSGDMYDYSKKQDGVVWVSTAPWNKYCDEIGSVILPEGLTSIGIDAFFVCTHLTSVTIPNSVTSIGAAAFSSCSGLTSVIIGNSVTSIGDGAFWNCSLTSVTIPNSVTSIGYQTFLDCSRLTSVTIGNGVTSIGGSAFANCSRLTSVTIGNGVTSIGGSAFWNCSRLNSVEIPNSVTAIDSHTFYGCSGLTSVIIGNSVTSIGGYAFSGCNSLPSVTIPNSVTSIGVEAFSGCSSLKSISLPDNLMMIKKQAFYGCKKLQKLDIPASVEYIYQEAFSGCNALSEIIARPETPPSIYNDTFSNYNCTLKVPDAGKDAYAAHEIWSKFGTIQTLSGEDIETPKCATPTISYQNGKLVFSSATEGAVCKSTITDTDIASFTGNEVQLTATYNISVYATKTGYDNSDVATATLCWIDKEPVIDVTNVSQVPAQAVLIQNEGGVLIVQGLDDGQQVRVYGIDGTQAGAAVSSNGQAVVSTKLQPDSVAIIKIGDRSVKVVVK